MISILYKDRLYIKIGVKTQLFFQGSRTYGQSFGIIQENRDKKLSFSRLGICFLALSVLVLSLEMNILNLNFQSRNILKKKEGMGDANCQLFIQRQSLFESAD